MAAFGFVTRMSLSSTNGRSITWIIPLVQITSARNTLIFLFCQVIEYPDGEEEEILNSVNGCKIKSVRTCVKFKLHINPA